MESSQPIGFPFQLAKLNAFHNFFEAKRLYSSGSSKTPTAAGERHVYSDLHVSIDFLLYENINYNCNCNMHTHAKHPGG